MNAKWKREKYMKTLTASFRQFYTDIYKVLVM